MTTRRLAVLCASLVLLVAFVLVLATCKEKQPDDDMGAGALCDRPRGHKAINGEKPNTEAKVTSVAQAPGRGKPGEMHGDSRGTGDDHVSAAKRSGGEKMISKSEAISIARKAIEGIMEYDKNLEIEVKLEGARYHVTFPIRRPKVPEGTRYRGPSFAARVTIDAKSGKVLKVLGAS